MRNLLLTALILASAYQIATGQTYTSGDYQYTLSNNQATITRYTGAGGAVSIPDTLNSYGVVSIGNNAFAYTDLTSVSIPTSVTSIGSYAFQSCFSLASVAIPNGVTSIGESVFVNCGSLTSVTIPNSLTSIGANAFYGCWGLGSVFLPSTLSSSQIGQAGFPSTAVFYVGSVGLPTSMASQADLATTQVELASTKAELAKIKADLAKTKTDLASYFAKFPNFIKAYLPRSIWSK